MYSLVGIIDLNFFPTQQLQDCCGGDFSPFFCTEFSNFFFFFTITNLNSEKNALITTISNTENSRISIRQQSDATFLAAF